MNRVVLSLLLLVLPVAAFAHGGGHEAPKAATPAVAETPSPTDALDFYGNESPADSGMKKNHPTGETNMYGMDTSQEDHSTHSMNNASEPSLSGSSFMDQGMNDLPPSSTALMEHAGHEMGNAVHVESARFTSVSSDTKGYGAAVGITVFSGLLFGVLSLVRPFE